MYKSHFDKNQKSKFLKEGKVEKLKEDLKKDIANFIKETFTNYYIQGNSDRDAHDFSYNLSISLSTMLSEAIEDSMDLIYNLPDKMKAYSTPEYIKKCVENLDKLNTNVS